MEAAGFNPHLAYGSGSIANTVNAPSLPQYTAPQQDFTAPTGLESAAGAAEAGLTNYIGLAGDITRIKKDQNTIRNLRLEADYKEARNHVYNNVTRPEALLQYAQRKHEYDLAITDNDYGGRGKGKYGNSQYQIDRNRS